jgi:hypothetical protein
MVEGRDQARVQALGDRDDDRRPRALEGLADQAVVGATGVEQGAPGLAGGGHGHRDRG